MLSHRSSGFGLPTDLSAAALADVEAAKAVHNPPMRLAWFSPMPPVRSGVSTVSAELVAALRASHEIDVFVHGSSPALPAGTQSAHDFVWLNRQAPYDLTIYQLGNSSAHDYLWPYLFRYPGLAVFHDLHLHHARAAALLRSRRADEYRAEFAANHPAANPDVSELAVAGFDSPLYYRWPMTRLVAQRSRLSAVHSEGLAAMLRAEAPGVAVETIRLGHGNAILDPTARERVRARYGIPADVVLFGCFGGLSPEKRVPQILSAFAATRAHQRGARLLLAGAVPEHYDLQADIRRWGIGESTIVTGYLESDAELDAHIAGCDVALNLRWPTAREISGPWLRCLAAGVPTVITQLAHLTEVPSLDPRTWRLSSSVDGSNLENPSPVCVAVDLLDEDHSLRLTLRRLLRDAALRAALGCAGRVWWEARHSPDATIEDYRRVIALASEQPLPDVPLPAHLIDDGTRTLDRLLAPFRVSNPLFQHVMQ